MHYVPFPIFATFISQGARERFFFLCEVQVFFFSSRANLSFPKCWIRELWVCDGVNTKNTLSSLHPLLWLQCRAAGQRRDYGHQTYSGDEVCHIRGVTLKEAGASVNPPVKPKSIYIPPLLRICVFVVVGVISWGKAQKPCLGFFSYVKAAVQSENWFQPCLNLSFCLIRMHKHTKTINRSIDRRSLMESKYTVLIEESYVLALYPSKNSKTHLQEPVTSSVVFYFSRHAMF